MKNDAVGTVVLVAIVAVCGYVWWTTSNFALALVLIIVAFFVVWLVDRIAFARRRTERAVAAGNPPHEPVLVDYARSFFPVLLAVLLLRTFVVEPFRIPSGSMMPTLLVGDFVLVNKFAYGLRLPVTNTKIFSTGEPRRGDIAVFRYPGNPKEDYIKRIVGVPGDTIKVVGQPVCIATEKSAAAGGCIGKTVLDPQVFVNGKEVSKTLVGAYHGTDKVSIRMEEGMSPIGLFSEDLNGVKHAIMVGTNPGIPADGTCTGGTALPDGCQWVVPKGHYFAMGDNRNDSEDSRFWGFVPEQNLAGRAFFIWFSIADWPHGLRRIGTVLH